MAVDEGKARLLERARAVAARHVRRHAPQPLRRQRSGNLHAHFLPRRHLARERNLEPPPEDVTEHERGPPRNRPLRRVAHDEHGLLLAVADQMQRMPRVHVKPHRLRLGLEECADGADRPDGLPLHLQLHKLVAPTVGQIEDKARDAVRDDAVEAVHAPLPGVAGGSRGQRQVRRPRDGGAHLEGEGARTVERTRTGVGGVGRDGLTGDDGARGAARIFGALDTTERHAPGPLSAEMHVERRKACGKIHLVVAVAAPAAAMLAGEVVFKAEVAVRVLAEAAGVVLERLAICVGQVERDVAFRLSRRLAGQEQADAQSRPIAAAAHGTRHADRRPAVRLALARGIEEDGQSVRADGQLARGVIRPSELAGGYGVLRPGGREIDNCAVRGRFFHRACRESKRYKQQ